MGLNSSKVNHKVRKVAPLDNKDVFVSPMQISKPYGLCDYGGVQSRDLLREGQLPPLRETLYGRGPIAPRPVSYDIRLESNDTSSIIKKHPPRRLQKLEPATLPTILSADRMTNKQGAAAGRQGKELEKKVATTKHSSSRRQHVHKMQMLELNRKREEMIHLQSQAEMKRNIQNESKINKHKMREMKAKKVRENAMRCHEDEDFPPVEHDETFNMDHGNSCRWTSRDLTFTPDCELRNNKLDLWFYPHQHGISPSSSSDSMDSWIREDNRSHRRPRLVRTRNEKIPKFDEFYDCEF